jgi:hypothetical protein
MLLKFTYEKKDIIPAVTVTLYQIHVLREVGSINHLKTKRRLLYLETQFVPRCKHFSYQL